jgi:hypothetical protein
MTLDALGELAGRLMTALAATDSTGATLDDVIEAIGMNELGLDAASAFWIALGFRGPSDVPPDPPYLDHYNLGRELARRFARPMEGRA